jgi:hypothetical protein
LFGALRLIPDAFVTAYIVKALRGHEPQDVNAAAIHALTDTLKTMPILVQAKRQFHLGLTFLKRTIAIDSQ